MPAANTVIRVDVAEFTSLLKDVKTFDAALGTELRKSIRAVGKKAADAAKREVLKEPKKNTGRSGSHAIVKKHKGLEHSVGTRGLRQAIAAGIRVDIKTGTSASSESGVFIRAHSSQLGSDAILVRRYNAKNGWRHPVFGNRNVWAPETGRPYFGAVIATFKPQLETAVQVALDRAAEALGRARTHTL